MMALKSGEERLKEMEAEMALFEQEVLGGPVAVTAGGPPVVEAVPVALAVPAVQAMPMIRPIIGTNTYQQIQQSLDARAATLVGPPPTFVGPAVPAVRPPPMMRPAFVPHILQRPGGQRMPMMRGPPPQGMMAPPLPRPPPPPPMMMAPPMAGPPHHPMGPIGPPMGSMNPVPPNRFQINTNQNLSKPAIGPKEIWQKNMNGLNMLNSHKVDTMTPVVTALPRPVTQPMPKVTPSVFQAAPTVYTAPPAHKRPDMRMPRQLRMEELAASVAEQQAAVMAAGLLEAKKDSITDDSVIGPSMPEPEPVHIEPPESVTEDKKKGKQEKVRKCIRTAAGVTWEDSSLTEWETDDFRIFCGDLGNEVNDDILTRAFSRYPSFLKAKVVRDKRTGKTKGYGFVSFKDPSDYVRAIRDMNGKYVGSRPIKLRKSTWKDRNLEIVRKKQKEKKKLGLR